MDILNPQTTIAINGETIAVRELNWRDGTAFLQSLAVAVAELLDAKGEFVPSAASFGNLITNSTELTEQLIAKATNKDATWLAERTMAEVLQLLNIALELNLNAELIARGKSLAERVRGAFGLTAPNP
jgi:hypothetical protein